MVAAVNVASALVLTTKVPDVDPAGMVIELGTVAKVEVEVRLTTVPPGPAGVESVTVPVDGDPPITVPGDRLSNFRPMLSRNTFPNPCVPP